MRLRLVVLTCILLFGFLSAEDAHAYGPPLDLKHAATCRRDKGADKLERCRAKKLKAVREYSICLLKAQESGLERALSLDLVNKRRLACLRDLERRFAAAEKSTKGCTDAGDADIAKILNSPFIAVLQRVTPQDQNSVTYSCQPAPEDNTTQRCVVSSSFLPLDLDALVGSIGLSGVSPANLAITIEAYGGKGHSGNKGGSGGGHGYATTTWTLQAFQNKSTDLYIYAGEHPDCGACGGSSSLVLFEPLADVDSNSIAADALLIAGGGGGAGSHGKHKYADGAAGGIAEAGMSVPGESAKKGGQGGNNDGNGSGGSTSSSSCGATDGNAGIGGYGGVRANVSDSSRAGWISTDVPSFADWSYGAGGIGYYGSSNGGAGGGGYGGGGGGCSKDGGGGGGSWAAAEVSFSGTPPSTCGPHAIPDASGKCDKGGGDGVVVINIRNDTP